jgi:hypothetical protein
MLVLIRLKRAVCATIDKPCCKGLPPHGWLPKFKPPPVNFQGHIIEHTYFRKICAKLALALDLASFSQSLYLFGGFLSFD